ncbi:xanthine dehydrogenase accessory protein XdhC [Dongia deserti]|uniref:xanthine dehydrogenase accessory protein XdhC n=1 Tax=Dongia deserti TaxID=2268030 RepID=UPI000E64C6F2|nr:xanthine dehydrogenase accessory protein XdhC [Dongia deserti]
MNWLSAALECIAADEKAVLVTVAEAKGSTPRESGAKMLVRERDIVGSVGGGQLELLAIDAARRMMADKATRPDLMRYSLGPDLGQCCGGAVRLLLEPLAKTDRRWLTQWQTQLSNADTRLLLTSGDGAKQWAEAEQLEDGARIAEGGKGWQVIEAVRRAFRPVWVFGAGHVGRALAKVLAELPFEVTWLDSRFDGFPAEIPAGVSHIVAPRLADKVDDAPPSTVFLVLTHSHQLDLDVCDRVLRREDFAFLGLIGSATKKARFLRSLKDRGHASAVLERLVCPIGLAQIPGKQPMAIAVATAAQLLTLSAAEQADSAHEQSTGSKRGAG